MQLFIQRVCTRICNLNNNSVIHPETICAVTELLSFPFVPKEYTGIEKKQRQAPKERNTHWTNHWLFFLSIDSYQIFHRNCGQIVKAEI